VKVTDGKEKEGPENDHHGKDNSIKGKNSKVERPWWKKSDAELVKDRYDDIKDYIDSKKIKVDDEDREALVEEARRRDPRIKNFLDMVPVKMKRVDREGDFLIVPVYSTDRGKKIAGRMGLKTKRRIRLDEFGWAVWELTNGKRDVRQIGERMRARFGDDIEPLHPRLSKFYAYLVTLSLVKIRNPTEGAGGDGKVPEKT